MPRSAKPSPLEPTSRADERWVSAAEAARALDVQQRSLYAYVSRGLVRSVPGPTGRRRLYSADDLARLRARHDARSGHGAVAAGALQFGDAVLDSAITELTPSGPAYRGVLAAELAARGTPFENVAELLWSGALCAEPVRWPAPSDVSTPLPPRARAPRPLPDILIPVVLAAAQRDPERADQRADAMARAGRHLLPCLAAACNPTASAAARRRATREPTIAARVAAAWSLPARAVPVVEQALVLLADHELNASTFAARVAAATGADPYAVVIAALCALWGPRHGTAVVEAGAFLSGLRRPADARTALAALRARGRVPPGFGHRAYAATDPRALPLWALAEQLARQSRPAARRVAVAAAVRDAAARERLWPNVDFSLATLVGVLDAPVELATAWYAVGRSAGWLAHAMEQRALGVLLRPRARYTGPPQRSAKELIERG